MEVGWDSPLFAQRRFSEEFKWDAVRLVVEKGYKCQAAATAVE